MTKNAIHIFTEHSIVTFCMDTFHVSEFYLYDGFYCILKKKTS